MSLLPAISLANIPIIPNFSALSFKIFLCVMLFITSEVKPREQLWLQSKIHKDAYLNGYKDNKAGSVNDLVQLLLNVS